MKTLKQIAMAGLMAGSALLASAVPSASAGEWGHGHGGCRSPKWSGAGYRGHDYVGGYAKEHGVKFSHGYFYAGKVQKHFTEKWYDHRFKTELYWDQHARSAYYWCEGHGVYYPIGYISEVAPGAKGPGPVVSGGGAVAGPAGAVSVPVGGAPVGGGAAGPATGGPATAGPAVGGQSSGPANVKPQQGAAPAQPINAAPASGGANGQPTVARADVQKIPAGTFDDAIPE